MHEMTDKEFEIQLVLGTCTYKQRTLDFIKQYGMWRITISMRGATSSTISNSSTVEVWHCGTHRWTCTSKDNIEMAYKKAWKLIQKYYRNLYSMHI